jgi:glycosyltransferase involved in cell wall biosynthesis
MKVTLFRDLPTEYWWSMERYADELAAALRAMRVNVREYAPRRPWPHLRGPANAMLNYAWRLSVYPILARSQQGDVNHIIDHSYAHLLQVFDARRTVVTCHDIAPLALNERGRGLGRRLWDAAFRAMQRSAHIVADSVHTRTELLKHTAYNASGITVIPLAASSSFGARPATNGTPELLRRLEAERRQVVLHVGSCAARKNVEAILQAVATLGGLRVSLVQIGGRWSAAQRQLLDELKLGDQVLQLPAIAESDLLGWYHGAAVFVFPSRYEGFGLPVLEAMAAGTPVVCSNSTSLPEVAGDAALLIDPQDVQAFADAIKAVLTASTLRASLIQRGLARSREFTWERTARQTLAIYQRVAEGG